MINKHIVKSTFFFERKESTFLNRAAAIEKMYNKQTNKQRLIQNILQTFPVTPRQRSGG